MLAPTAPFDLNCVALHFYLVLGAQTIAKVAQLLPANCIKGELRDLSCLVCPTPKVLSINV